MLRETFATPTLFLSQLISSNPRDDRSFKMQND